MRRLDQLALDFPTWGSRKLVAFLAHEGLIVNRKRVQRLRQLMGLETTYRGPRLSDPALRTQRFPYLLRGLTITRPNEVWCADITYIPMKRGFLYLFAILDWASRKIMGWRISTTLDTLFCIECLDLAIKEAGCSPKIFNTDQGAQFTSQEWIDKVTSHDCLLSHDGKGRWRDNVLIERFWRTLKYDDVYPQAYENGVVLHKGLKAYMKIYNHVRPHDALDGLRPAEAYLLEAVKPAKVVP